MHGRGFPFELSAETKGLSAWPNARFYKIIFQDLDG